MMKNQELRSAVYAGRVAAAYYHANPLVTLIDVGYQLKNNTYTGDLAVRVHLKSKPTGAAFEAFSSEHPNLVIDKSLIPFPVVDIIQATYHFERFWEDRQVKDPRAQPRDPLCGGLSVASEWLYGYGTLGGIVEDRLTRQKMILSNWHVLVGSDYAPANLRVIQPGFGDGGSHLNTVAYLVRHAFDSDIDAAVAALTGDRDWENNQLGIGPVTGASQPIPGMQVTKSGRRTGVTHGLIDGIEGQITLYYGGFPHTISNVTRIVPTPEGGNVSSGGDSGSWWLDESTRAAVGLHFAGQDEPDYALAIAMPQVLDALGVDIAIQEPIPQPARVSPAVPPPAPESARELERVPA